MDIVLLGSGNVATHLGGALVRAGHRIKQVYSRTEAHAKTLAAALDAAAISDLTAVDVHADIYIIAVRDDALAAVAAQLPATLRGIVTHTAGSVDMDVLASYATQYGVVYPVQTFSRVKAIDFSMIPIAVEASDEEAKRQLLQFASSLSGSVFPCDSRQRLSLHMAAVFACNFTNHLYAIAADILDEHDLDFDLIRPLILETARKVTAHQPKDVQTGPAVRNDVGTMQKHIGLLGSHPELVELYRYISNRIRNARGKT